jgi:hypothetical protein
VIPIIKVKTGLNELSIPATELSILVCASGNRKAGMPLPKNPMIRIERMLSLLSFFIEQIAAGRRQMNEIKILREATWHVENDSSPFFINI